MSEPEIVAQGLRELQMGGWSTVGVQARGPSWSMGAGMRDDARLLKAAECAPLRVNPSGLLLFAVN